MRGSRVRSPSSQGAAESLLISHEGAANGKAQRSGLSGDSTAGGLCFHVKSVHRAGNFERAQDRVLHREARKIIGKLLAVDFETSTPLAQADLGDGGLARPVAMMSDMEKQIRQVWDSERRADVDRRDKP